MIELIVDVKNCLQVCSNIRKIYTYPTKIVILILFHAPKYQELNKLCIQAYVGVAHDLNAIVIAFRGTQENRYW